MSTIKPLQTLFFRTGLRLLLAGLFASGAVSAAELLVSITGDRAANAEVGCGLYAAAEGFPMDRSKAVTRVWQKSADGVLECRFANLQPGRYAIAVLLDTNGNRKTDTNFLGIPKESWGVSNNVRPRLRAPRFEEAAFAVGDEGVTRIQVELAR